MIQYKKDNSGASNKTRDEGEQAHMAKKNVNQAIESEKDAVLWHDRKRVLGMPGAAGRKKQNRINLHDGCLRSVTYC